MADGPRQSIEHARRGVRKALQQWNAADLNSIGESRVLLEQSVTDIKLAIELLRNGDTTMANGLQPSIASLRRDISTMTRLVDACSAFHRGLSLRLGGALPAYDASGMPVKEPEIRPAHGLVG